MTNKEMVDAFLHSSKQFLEASDRAAKIVLRDGEFHSANIPSVVCLAFSVELGLKALYILDYGKKTDGHDLEKLYVKLKDATKKKMESNVKIPDYPKYINPKNINDYLSDHSRSFVDWRYCCEKNANLFAHTGFLKELAMKIHQMVSEGLELL